MGHGIPALSIENTLVATWNDAKGVRELLERHENAVAAIILEPVMMNVGVMGPRDGFLQELRALCDEFGCLLVFDEVKTGAKLAWGGAQERYKVKADIVCLAKAIGGGLPLGAFGSRREVMDEIASFRSFHAGTYASNPLATSACIAALERVLVKDIYPKTTALGDALAEGHNKIIKKHGLPWCAVNLGANGTVFWRKTPPTNYREWLDQDFDSFWRYWHMNLNRGVIPQAQCYDEQWTVSALHEERDVDAHARGLRRDRARDEVRASAPAPRGPRLHPPPRQRGQHRGHGHAALGRVDPAGGDGAVRDEAGHDGGREAGVARHAGEGRPRLGSGHHLRAHRDGSALVLALDHDQQVVAVAGAVRARRPPLEKVEEHVPRRHAPRARPRVGQAQGHHPAQQLELAGVVGDLEEALAQALVRGRPGAAWPPRSGGTAEPPACPTQNGSFQRRKEARPFRTGHAQRRTAARSARRARWRARTRRRAGSASRIGAPAAVVDADRAHAAQGVRGGAREEVGQAGRAAHAQHGEQAGAAELARSRRSCRRVTWNRPPRST